MHCALLPSFTERLENMLLGIRDVSVTLCGDFNVDLLTENENSNFFNMLYSVNFLPVVNIATRITENSATCIDQIWHNKFNVANSGVIVSDISDHYPVFATFNIFKDDDLVTKTFRDHSRANLRKLCSAVELIANRYVGECINMNVDSKCNWFVENFKDVYNSTCPKKTKIMGVKRLLKPWITSEIRRMADYKHRLFKQQKMNLIPFHTYNIYKNNLSRRIKLSKKNYYVNKFKDCNSNIKNTWKTINSIMSNNKRSPKKFELLNENGNLITDPVDVGNNFCEYFSSVACKLDENIPRTDTDPLHFMPDQLPETFTPAPATTDEIVKLIKSFKDRPCNINNIPVFIYKTVALYIAPVICDIFNCTLSEGKFPSILKLARILPLHKSKSHKITNNFRPISLLPMMAKIVEKLMKARAVQFIEDNSILYNKQFGFRTGCSTSDAVLHFVDDCVTALDNKLYTVSIFLDFSKAFDTVNREILLRKLDRLGFRGNILNFFDSYLSDRQMYVSINGHDSTIKTTNIGLPQGSVSATWLFSLYINDMHRTSNKLKFIHFADDTTVYMSGSNLTALCADVCEELNVIDDWLKANRLSLNKDKTYFMIHTHNKFNINDCMIKIGDTPITYVRSMKFLGLTLDDRFSYNDHLQNLIKQLSKIKGLLYKLSAYVPPYIIRKLYYALFYSRLLYNISVWGNTSVTNINRVRRINSSVVNIFMPSLPDIMPLPLSYDNLYKYVCLKTFHNYLHSDFFVYFRNKILTLIPSHVYSTRFSSNSSLILPALYKTVSPHQFLFTTVKLWNTLPPEIKEIQDRAMFVNRTKVFLLNNS